MFSILVMSPELVSSPHLGPTPFLVLGIKFSNVNQKDTASESDHAPPDVEVLQNKGAIFILMSLGLSDSGQTFTEIREQSHLSNGTTQRRLEELQESGWIRAEATTNEKGKAVKKYHLSEQTKDMVDGFKQLGEALLK